MILNSCVVFKTGRKIGRSSGRKGIPCHGVTHVLTISKHELEVFFDLIERLAQPNA